MSFGLAGDGQTVLDIDEAATRTAEQWLAEGAPSNQRWVLWVPLIYPHQPFVVDEPSFSLHDRAEIPAPISFDAAVDPSLLRNRLMLAGAGLPEGRVVGQPIEMIDLLPTLLDLAEAAAGHTHFGKSLIGVIEDPHNRSSGVRLRRRRLPTGRSHADREHQQRHPRAQVSAPEGTTRTVGTAMVLRTPTHTCVHRRHEADEFHDRVTGPNEIVNLLASGDSPPIATELRELASAGFLTPQM